MQAHDDIDIYRIACEAQKLVLAWILLGFKCNRNEVVAEDWFLRSAAVIRYIIMKIYLLNEVAPQGVLGINRQEVSNVNKRIL